MHNLIYLLSARIYYRARNVASATRSPDGTSSSNANTRTSGCGGRWLTHSHCTQDANDGWRWQPALTHQTTGEGGGRHSTTSPNARCEREDGGCPPSRTRDVNEGWRCCPVRYNLTERETRTRGNGGHTLIKPQMRTIGGGAAWHGTTPHRTRHANERRARLAHTHRMRHANERRARLAHPHRTRHMTGGNTSTPRRERDEEVVVQPLPADG